MRIEGKRGLAEIEAEGRTVRVHCAGRMGPELVPPAEAFVEEVACARGPVALFVDAADVIDYDPEYRRAVVDWIRAARGRSVSTVHILFRSYLVATGVALFNLVVPAFMVHHHERASFEAARRALARPGLEESHPTP
jgi:hypothetical protein